MLTPGRVIMYFMFFLSLYFSVFWLLVFIERKTQAHKRKKLKSLPTVSIIIPAFNEETRIIPTLKSALSLNYPKKKLDIIVVNDGSTDKTEKLVKRFLKNKTKFPVKLINQENGGKGKALNRGLNECKGEYYVCFDADSFVDKNALHEMLPYFSSKNVAAVLPVLKVKKPKRMLEKLQWYEYLINMFFKENMGKLNCVHILPGPFSVYRTQPLKEVGGFDENHNITEDLEMALRFQEYGYKMIQLPHTDVRTIPPNNVKDLYKQRNRWFKGSVLNAINYRHMIFNKKYGDFGFIQIPTLIIGGLISITLVSTILYNVIKPWTTFMYNMWFVGFDFMTYLRTFQFNFNILDLNFPLITIAIFMMCFSLFIFFESHKFTKESKAKFGLGPIILYIAGYFLLLGVMWFGVAFDLLFKRKQQW